MTVQVGWTKKEGWIPIDKLGLALSDWGLLQGAIAVDRLRTFDGKLTERSSSIAAHLERFCRSCHRLGIGPVELEQLNEVLAACVERNRSAFSPDTDFSLVTLATPGTHFDAREPTFMVYPTGISWGRLRSWYSTGQELIVASSRSVPAECWTPELKTRARLQYYLADQEAYQVKKGTGAVLLDADGNLTETSIANLIVVKNAELCIPPTGSILQGVSLQRTIRLAEANGITVRRKPLSLDFGLEADELLLCGTTGCLWPASSLGEHRFAAVEGSMYQTLRRHWIQDLEFDYESQALNHD